MADSKLRVLINADWKGGSATNQAKRDIGKLDNATELAGNAFKGLATGAGVVVASMGAVGLAAKETFELLEEGAQINATAETFDNLASSINATSDSLLVGLREATQGAVSDLVLMEGANAQIVTGLAGTAEEAAKLTEVAVKLGSAFGATASESIENFNLLLLNQSIPRLDSFGLSSSRVKIRLEELTTGVNALDRETAFTIATLEEAEIAIAKIGDTAEDALGFAQARAEFENNINAIKSELSEELAPAILDIADNVIPEIGAALVAIADVVPEVVESFKGFLDLGVQLEQISLIKQLNEAGVSLLDINKILGDTRLRVDFGRTADEVEDEVARLEAGVIRLAKTQELLDKGIDPDKVADLVDEYFRLNEVATVTETVIRNTGHAFRTINADTIAFKDSLEDVPPATEEVIKATEELDEELETQHDRFLIRLEEQREALRERNEGLREDFGVSAFTNLSSDVEDAVFDEKNALLEGASAAGITASQFVTLALATGDYSEAALNAALQAALMAQKVQELITKLDNNEISAEQAVVDLEAYKTVVENFTLGESAAALDALSNSVDNTAESVTSLKSALLELDGTTANVTVNTTTTGGGASAGQGFDDDTPSPRQTTDIPRTFTPPTTPDAPPSGAQRTSAGSRTAAPITIIINGAQSPQATARAVNRELGELIRR